MATDPDPLINRMFDRRYLIVRKLGSGGMADVYLAEDEELGRKVALKMLDERHARDEQFVERFKREARNAAGLSHPHIVRIYDRGQAEGTYYIAMEYLDGPTLKELLVRKGPTPPLTAIKFAREILSALAEAHKHEIVHRDIKPHNVIVSPDWHVKVTDFGIARSGASQMTEVGSIVGTAQYLSPEQARGAPVDQRSDLYSLGIVLYELLTGKVPFTGDAAVEIAMKHLSEIPVPPSKLRPEISHDLDAVVMRALAKDPDDRYASAEEMDADLARIARGAAVSRRTEEAMTQVLSGTGIAAAAPTVVSRPPSGPGSPAPPPYRPPAYYEELPRRRSLWPMLAGVLVAAILAVIGYLVYNKVQSQIDKNGTIAVQDVSSVPRDNAILLLHNQGLRVRVLYHSSDTIPAKEVISQDIGPNDPRVAKNTRVTITVSTGKPKVQVPFVTGFTQEQAVSELGNKGLKADPHFIHSLKAAPGTVTAESPAAGSLVLEGSVVRINVSQGPKLIPVPNEVGQPYANAKSAIEGAGFRVLKRPVYGPAPVDQVTAQDPGAGAQEPAGTEVTLTVSLGPKTADVPNVVADDQSDAVQLLQSRGFTPSIVQKDVTDPSQDGLVLDQSPAQGTIKQGSVVTITVGRLVIPTTPTTTAATTTAQTTTEATTTTATTTAATTTAETTTEATTTTAATTAATTTTPTATTPTTTAATTTATTTTTPAITTPTTTTPTTTTPAITTPTTTAATTPTTTAATTTAATTTVETTTTTIPPPPPATPTTPQPLIP